MENIFVLPVQIHRMLHRATIKAQLEKSVSLRNEHNTSHMENNFFEEGQHVEINIYIITIIVMYDHHFINHCGLVNYHGTKGE